jgi:hypothetical protein
VQTVKAVQDPHEEAQRRPNLSSSGAAAVEKMKIPAIIKGMFNAVAPAVFGWPAFRSKKELP